MRRSPVEVDDERGQTAVLRGTVEAVQAAHGEAPGLPVPSQTEADVHRGWEKDADIRVQDADAPAAERDEAAVVQGRGRRSVRRRARRGRHQFRVSARRVHIAGSVVLAGQFAVVRRRQSRRGLGADRHLTNPDPPPPNNSYPSSSLTTPPAVSEFSFVLTLHPPFPTRNKPLSDLAIPYANYRDQ